jgi:hypothetical protein
MPQRRGGPSAGEQVQVAGYSRELRTSMDNQSIPGKGWFMILRLYGPLEAWFQKMWRPGEIDLQG